MIIFKNPISVLTRNDKPNVNWAGETGVFVVDDASELGKKILLVQPYFDFILDSKGNLIDITPTGRPPAPDPVPTPLELLQADNASLWYELMMGGI
ncbi:hypothetical protein E4K67_22365 [Desulfosporosinus fructosivorans]|uniref:Uncharacterized protein n=1 Tax=Desulfosporosinus fructosivorans TaxID=2018669 RepID=A0A4Z0R0J5_9FIRM|nr:hypothetical protein [Desulfosporosinus fructosivorans]TGE35865.1 hypothetical protein E4K67_22365 [Desulfosporosinus fructosivorans]